MKRLQRLFVALAMILLPLAVSAQATLSIEDFDIKGGEEKEMVIDLTNPNDEITLAQFDLRLPTGLSLKQVGSEYDIDMCDRTTWRKHSLDANETDGIIRFLLASSSNTVISGSEGAIIKMTLVADGSFTKGDICLEKILLVSPNEKEIKPSDIKYSVGDIAPNDDWKDGDEFTAKTVEGVDMKFKVLSAKNHTCQVGWQLSSQELENGVFDDYIAIDPMTKGTITIPSEVNGLQVLGVSHGAFAECEGITSVQIPEGATFIGACAFFGCKSLVSVDMPESLVRIGYTEYKESWYSNDYVFWHCNSLTSITIPKNVSIFGRFLFEGASALTSIYSLNENPTDAGYAFHDDPWTIGKICSIATLYVPAGTKAKYQAAEGWKNFKNIVEEGNAPEPPQTTAYLTIEPFSIKAGETREMVIDLTNPEDEITLVQFDLRLPEGLTLKQVGGEYDIDMCDRTTWRRHSLDANATDGIIRFLLASSSNTLIDGTEGAIIKMTLVADGSYQGEAVRLEKILLVSPDEKEIKPADVVYKPGDGLGIATVSDVRQASGQVYSLSGHRLAAPKKGINIVGGRKVVVK